MQTLIAYDISDDKSRNKVFKLLKNQGKKVQKSIFFINADRNKIYIIESFIKNLLKDDDSLLIMPCCESCIKNARISMSDISNSYCG